MDRYENIKIPDSLDSIIDDAILKAEKRKKVSWLKVPIAVAIITIIFISSVNVSPVFASYLSKVPLLRGLVELVQFDKGLKSIIEEGYVQKVNLSDEDNGIIFTVNNYILDRRRLIIDYSLYSKENNVTLYAPEFTDENGKHLNAFITYYLMYSEEKNEAYRDVIDIRFSEDIDKLPSKINISCDTMKKREDNKESEINGHWEVEFDLDNSLNVKPKIYTLNKDVTLGEVTFNIQDIKVYPTTIDMRVKLKNSKNIKFVGFNTPKMIYGKNNEILPYMGATLFSDEEISMHFQSNYFINSNDLYFQAEGIYCMPKEEQYVILDVENKKVLDDSGYNIEYVDTEKENIIFGDDNTSGNIMLRIRDEKILSQNNEKNFNSINFNSKAYDESGKEYIIGQGFSRDKDSMETFINFDKKQGNPKSLKLKINSVYSGIKKKIFIVIE